MSAIKRLSHLIVICYSQRWSTSIVSEYQQKINSMISQLENQLKTSFPELWLESIFIPVDFSLEKTSSSNKEIKKIINDASYVILDITDYDEELAYVNGIISAYEKANMIIVAETYLQNINKMDNLALKPITYKDIEDIGNNLEIISTELISFIEKNPIPSRFIYNLWFPRNVSSIYIVCPQIKDPGEYAIRSSPDYTYLDNLGDTDSLLEIMVFLSRYYPNATIEKFSSKDLPIGLTKGNLVILGGPGSEDSISNHLAKSMMEAVNSRVIYTDDCETMKINDISGQTLNLKAKLTNNVNDFDINDRFNLKTDYGYFSRFKNPANEVHNVICINGIHTSGVLGSARAFGDNFGAIQNYKSLLESNISSLEFESFFEVNVINGDIIVPKITIGNLYKIKEELEYSKVSNSRRNQNNLINKKLVKKEKSNINTIDNEKVLNKSNGNLRLVSILAKKIKKEFNDIFENTSGIFLLHVLPDLIPFLAVFKSLGLHPSGSIFFFKHYPYYQKESTLEFLRTQGYQVFPLEEMKSVLPEFISKLKSNQRVFILEDGGYVGPLLHSLEHIPWSQILGSVEQTERGVRLYEKIEDLKIPVSPVARSEIKDRQEPPHIGRTIIENIKKLLINVNLAGKRCLVIGYGRIGESVCIAARNQGMNVSVFDINRGILTKAAQDSFNASSDLRSLLADAQIIIGTTGNQSLNEEHILSLRHGAILVSGSSGQYEIGIEALESFSLNKNIKDIGTEYILAKEDKKVLLLGDGYPINFFSSESIAEEAIDPVLSALFIATTGMIIARPKKNGLNLEWTNQLIHQYELENLFFELYFSK